MRKIIPRPNSYNFSVDDVFESLIEVTDKKLSLFDQSFFKFIKGLHNKFNADIHCYLFYRGVINGKLRSLQEVPSDIKNIIRENSWLRFGPHSLDYNTAPYAERPEKMMETFDKIYSEIYRFAGNEHVSEFARLHYFSELYELADYFESKGVKALFSTDKDILTHRMPKSIKKSLSSQGVGQYKGMNFIRTHFRIEYFITDYKSDKARKTYLKNLLDTFGFIIFFTHECDISNPKVRRAIISCLQECKDFGLIST